MKTYSEARARLRWYQGRYIDFDGWYGYQCADLAVDYIYWLLEIRMWGNAKDAINNDFKNMATVYENTPSFVPQIGDVAVFTKGIYKQYGHIGLVFNGGNTNQFLILEQNYDGNANTPAKLRWDNYYGCTHFIRPKYKSEGLMNKITNKVKPPAQKVVGKSASKITVGSKAPYNLKWSKGAYFNAKIDGLGATSATRYGDNRTNYRFDVGQAVYAPGTLIYVFEIIDGWCRIYWNNHNEWIWHERLIVKEVF
ncbi:TPA: CHAP domain-containing protein [Staphylococcus aureus]|nr:CHAP domain-containing protein [Staphylococcus aureus]HBU9607512.1 CHAP domain-containing protein [Staphylococcus aureus]HBU9610613.1 CHAP domain-containing protein [Staphylococcus aureus]HCY5960082.1 CHAP domain-containing protein [Staphylococcus aureus]HCY7353651.1 CHAP domain-containing protein [Staphylococcus aureus]